MCSALPATPHPLARKRSMRLNTRTVKCARHTCCRFPPAFDGKRSRQNASGECGPRGPRRRGGLVVAAALVGDPAVDAVSSDEQQFFLISGVLRYIARPDPASGDVQGRGSPSRDYGCRLYGQPGVGDDSPAPASLARYSVRSVLAPQRDPTARMIRPPQTRRHT